MQIAWLKFRIVILLVQDLEVRRTQLFENLQAVEVTQYPQTSHAVLAKMLARMTLIAKARGHVKKKRSKFTEFKSNFWVCSSSCTQSYSIEIEQKGNGDACEEIQGTSRSW